MDTQKTMVDFEPARRIHGLNLVKTAKGDGGIIGFLRKKFKPSIKGTLRDNYGTFALVTHSFIMVGKYKPYGSTVSCHKQAAYAALNQKKKLLLYLQDRKEFYLFEPREIIEQGYINFRTETEFLNFPLNLGMRIEI